nr:hypothetical protein BaRGS_018547 [Batillaria attramentaria]
MYWRLTAEEDSLITQLTAAYKDTAAHNTFVSLSSCLSGHIDHDHLILLQQIASDMVRFFKRVPDFTRLKLHDQAAAFKAKAMRVLLIRNAFSFTDDVDEVNSVSIATPPHVTRHENLVQRLVQFYRTLKIILRDDVSLAVLLQCGVTFGPLAPEIYDRQTTSQLQEKYMIIMKHYMESKYSYLFAWQYCEGLMDKVEETRELAAEVMDRFCAWESILQPLLKDFNSVPGD